MASDAANYPVPYDRLKDIANDACEKALSSVSAYDHSQTESWNTDIISAILSALVKETTPTSNSANGAAQPQFKFVVNSTIIQHAVAPQGAEGGKAGRRGMHSASGAFWNNEKDGMSSFKYEAAEAKGLDVVVGIIWVWSG